jgi:hypothetical protein
MPDEDPDARPAAGGRARKLRTWLVGIALAAVTAALTDVATGGITDGVSSAWDALTGSEEAKPPPPKVRAPLIVSARVQRGRRSAFVFEQPRSELTPLPATVGSDAARAAWVERNDGIDAFTTAVEITVEGRSAAAVILSGLTVTVASRDAPPTGTLLEAEGAGGIGVRYFTVDLDQPMPTPELGEANEPRPGERPLDFPYKVSLSDPEVFVLFANTQRCDCRWTAELRWRSGGKEGTTTIRDGREPFRTASGDAAKDVIQRSTTAAS